MRAWTALMISALSIPCKYTVVTRRFAWPSWRWITFGGTPLWHLDGVSVAQLVRGEAA